MLSCYLFNAVVIKEMTSSYSVVKVGMIAANDGVLLRNHIPRILKKHFKGKPYYVDLLDLFNEVVRMARFALSGFILLIC